MSFLPITSKLNPFGGVRNLAYLAEIAALTRMTTGVVRVWQNNPDKLHDPRLTRNDKHQAFWERFFVEIIGTAGYMFFLHLGQDLTSKLVEARTKIPFLPKGAKNLSPAEVEAMNRVMTDVYGQNSKNLIYRVLYGDEFIKDGKKITRKANMTSLRERLVDELGDKAGNQLFEKGRGLVDGFARKLNKLACLSIVGGVALSALYGGFVTQWLNDRIIAPLIRRTLSRRYAQEPAPAQANPPPMQAPTSQTVPMPNYQPSYQPPALMPAQSVMPQPAIRGYGYPIWSPMSQPVSYPAANMPQSPYAMPSGGQP